MSEQKDTSAESATVPAAPIANDLDVRLAAFNVDLRAICGKHEIKLAAQPRIFNGLIVADPVAQDARVAAAEAPAPEAVA